MLLVASASPAVYETLKSDDVSGILNELVEAQNQSYVLGLKLLPAHEVEAIHRQYQDPKERLIFETAMASHFGDKGNLAINVTIYKTLTHPSHL